MSDQARATLRDWLGITALEDATIEHRGRIRELEIGLTLTNADLKQAHAAITDHEERLQQLEATPEEPTPSPSPTQTITYTEDTSTDFPNPERGWYTEDKYWGAAFGTKVFPSPVSAVVSENRPTLEMYFVNLSGFRTSAISAAKLAEITNNFVEARSSGVKLVLRFAYNRVSGGADTTLAWMKAHIDQLEPLWTTYQDVIAVLQGGFIGFWGEQHSSTSGISQSASAREEFLAYLLAHTPPTMMVQFRYPFFVGLNLYRTPLGSPARFTGAAQARLGQYNDSWMVNEHHGGTFGGWDGMTREAEFRYAFGISPYVCMGGESSNVGGLNSYNDAANSRLLFTRLGMDYLNSDYWLPMIQKWDATPGALEEFSRRLGYRLVLRAATVPTSVTAGASMSVALSMSNVGFGKVYNVRPLDLVFVGSGGPFTARLSGDARRILPLAGETVAPSFTVDAPAGLVAGQSYALHLRLPDPSANLAADNEYAIRFANSGVWASATGYNSLGANVVAA